MKKVLLPALTVVVSVALGVGAASGRPHAHTAVAGGDPSVFGFGSFGPGGPNTNQFYVTASSATNGSGGSGSMFLFDPSTHVFSSESVSCVYVDPGTGDATVWGNVNDPHTNSFPPGPNGSVEMVFHPGTDSSAGVNVRSFYGTAPTTCGPPTIGFSPLIAGTVSTTP